VKEVFGQGQEVMGDSKGNSLIVLKAAWAPIGSITIILLLNIVGVLLAKFLEELTN